MARGRQHKSRTRGQHSFAQVPTATIPRSSFVRNFGVKTTFDAGLLIPFFVDEVLPGDTMNMRGTAFARLATPIHPFMDNMTLDFFMFFVPNRLLWDNWQKFMGEQENPGDSIDYTIPQVVAPASGGWAEQSLGDYMGVPTKVDSLECSVLPFRAYNLIYNEWFRDENLVDSVPKRTGDGPDSFSDYNLQRRGKRHDYFTSCLPFPQKGPSVTLGIGAQAPVVLDEGLIYPAKGTGNFVPTFSISGTGGYELEAVGDNNSDNTRWNLTAGTGDGGRASWSQPKLETDISGATGVADLSAATAATVNQLREGFQIQKLLERDARGGTRYTEIVRSHFGVVSPDARLQRPEVMGTGSIRVNVNPVAQTSGTPSSGNETAQGNLAAFGTAAGGQIGFTKSFTEHGYLIGLVCARADLNYQRGLERHWSRKTRYDYYFPAFSHLGEQAVLNREIYTQNNAEDDEVFGYQERHAEYRYKPSLITGLFRSNASQSLDSWHLAQDFGSTLPKLDKTFIEENPPVERVIADSNQPHFIMDSFFSYRCARPMPMYSVPGLIDHF